MTRRKSATKPPRTEPTPIRGQSTAQRLSRVLGPEVAQVLAPITGEKFLVDRPDITELARARHFPAPLTAMVRTIISKGTDQVTAPAQIEQYLSLCYELVLACARVDPPELIEAMDADAEAHEDATRAWQAEVDEMEAESRRLFDAKSSAADDGVRESLEREWKVVARDLTAKRAAKPELDSSRTRAALRAIDADTLKPLFVRPGEDADEDQLILLPPGDSTRPRAKDRTWKFGINDYTQLGAQIMTFQEGGFGIFRDIA